MATRWTGPAPATSPASNSPWPHEHELTSRVPVGAEDPEDLPVLDTEAHVVDSDLRAVSLVQAVDLYDGHGRIPRRACPSPRGGIWPATMLSRRLRWRPARPLAPVIPNA